MISHAEKHRLLKRILDSNPSPGVHVHRAGVTYTAVEHVCVGVYRSDMIPEEQIISFLGPPEKLSRKFFQLRLNASGENAGTIGTSSNISVMVSRQRWLYSQNDIVFLERSVRSSSTEADTVFCATARGLNGGRNQSRTTIRGDRLWKGGFRRWDDYI